VNCSFFLFLATSRTVQGLCHTYPVLRPARALRTAFPSVPALRSARSAADCPALFVGFLATMAGSDSSRPFIIGYGSSPSRCRPLGPNPAGQARGLPVPVQGPSAHAKVFDHAGSVSARASVPAHFAFRYQNSVGTRNMTSFAAQWLACALLSPFTTVLADCSARLGADAVRYS
jgi:hypothetical protein